MGSGYTGRLVVVPDPAHAGFPAAAEAAWYARLPTMFAAAAALFTDAGTTEYLPWTEP
jgi:hypothetical protein